MMASKADADIRQFLAAPLPPGTQEDLRDLGVIGYANQIRGVTAATLTGLIDQAMAHGRTWDDIGRTLDMTADEAKHAYEKLSAAPPGEPAAPWRKRLRAILDAMPGRASGLQR